MEYKIRSLTDSDYTNYLQLINQFRPTTFNEKDYKTILNQIHKNSTIWVIEYNHELIGTATLIYEYKFIRNIVKLAHVEDVCIDHRYRNKGLGTILLKFLVNEATNEQCYKIILDCDETLEHFYNKSGFKKNGIQMAHYFIPL
jgi:glucosamine-phosphate N-acetyltransferase